MVKVYKLRIYKLNGKNKGNLDHEELFVTKEKMEKRYKELFKTELHGLNPTAWEFVDKEWKRLA